MLCFESSVYSFGLNIPGSSGDYSTHLFLSVSFSHRRSASESWCKKKIHGIIKVVVKTFWVNRRLNYLRRAHRDDNHRETGSFLNEKLNAMNWWTGTSLVSVTKTYIRNVIQVLRQPFYRKRNLRARWPRLELPVKNWYRTTISRDNKNTCDLI